MDPSALADMYTGIVVAGQSVGLGVLHGAFTD